MEDLTLQLETQLNDINNLISVAEKNLKNSSSVPEGIAKVSYCRGDVQYYLKKPGESRFRYVHSSQRDEIKLIIQHDYDVTVYDILLNTRKAIISFLKKYNIDRIEKAYDSLGKGRKMLVDPIIPSKDDVIRKWYEGFVTDDNGFQSERQYFTEKGEKVRSKSEKILADIFNKHGIPYVYEPKLVLNNGHTVFPDFALLNIRKRKTVYWEHFGLISDPDYTVKCMAKLDEYERSGFVCGDNLIFSIESMNNPFYIRMMEKKIQLLLL